MAQRVAFVSDLHLFTRRSKAPRYLEAMRSAAARSKTFVLGGDIFDFRWSTLGTTSATVEAAVQWLEQFAADHPDCHFHYLLGNHNYHRRFLQRLSARGRCRIFPGTGSISAWATACSARRCGGPADDHRETRPLPCPLAAHGAVGAVSPPCLRSGLPRRVAPAVALPGSYEAPRRPANRYLPGAHRPRPARRTAYATSTSGTSTVACRTTATAG